MVNTNYCSEIRTHPSHSNSNNNNLNFIIMVAINIELGENLLDRYEVVDYLTSLGIKVKYSSLIRFYTELNPKDRIGMFIRDQQGLEESLLKACVHFNILFIDLLYRETEDGKRLYNPSFKGKKEQFNRDNVCTFFYTD